MKNPIIMTKNLQKILHALNAIAEITVQLEDQVEI